MASEDLTASPTTQIRDGQVLIRTPSLLELGNAAVPEEIVRDLFKQEWIPTEATPLPHILVHGDEIQANLEQEDYIEIECELITVQWQGHRHEYVHKQTPILVHMHSIHSRQRVYNMAEECWRIIAKWILSLAPYHSLDWDGFQPEYPGPNSFEGTAHITLRQDALPVFLQRVAYAWNPATDPHIIPGTQVLP